MRTRPVERDVKYIGEDALEAQHGGARWKMLFSAERTPTDSITCGVAIVSPDQALVLHRHAHAEVYYGLEGEACAVIDGKEYDIAPGKALFIPGNTLHGVRAEASEAKFLFVFAADRFSDVHYVFFEEL